MRYWYSKEVMGIWFYRGTNIPEQFITQGTAKWYNYINVEPKKLRRPMKGLIEISKEECTMWIWEESK